MKIAFAILFLAAAPALAEESFAPDLEFFTRIIDAPVFRTAPSLESLGTGPGNGGAPFENTILHGLSRATEILGYVSQWPEKVSDSVFLRIPRTATMNLRAFLSERGFNRLEMELRYSPVDFLPTENGKCAQTEQRPFAPVVFDELKCAGLTEESAGEMWLREAAHHMGLGDRNAGKVAVGLTDAFRIIQRDLDNRTWVHGRYLGAGGEILEMHRVLPDAQKIEVFEVTDSSTSLFRSKTAKVIQVGGVKFTLQSVDNP